jgi:hypothetical protein
MVGTYAALAVILVAAAATGQGLFALCGRRDWSWLAPAVGLAVIAAVTWGALSVTDEPAVALIAGALVAAAGAVACARTGALPANPLTGCIVVLAAVALASLPFLVEGRFGILGTSLNPDMSQHLFAADRLAGGGEERLASEGYPLGPHAIVVAVAELGPSLVAGFSGLTLAIAVAASLAPLSVLGRLGRARQIAGGLLVGLAYMASSYLIQGAFKETMQALFVLAFAIGLHQLATRAPGGVDPAPRWRYLGAVPLAALAVGSVYAYSFPGLTWLAGALGVWALAELMMRRSLEPLRAVALPAAVAIGVLCVAVAPELGRIADFASFETFDPDGAGYGNLFPGHPISPFEALGIWPSGDFRLEAGAGFAPSPAFWLGGLVGLIALGFGLVWWLRRRETAVPAALAAAAVLYFYALVAGTPYQEAKAIAIAAPLAMLVSVRALLEAAPPVRELSRATGRALAVPALALAFLVPAAACSVLALANGPVGPDEWTPDLIELRESGKLGPGGEDGDDTLVVAPEAQLVDERGEDLYLWELRGGNVCAAALGERVPSGIENLVAYSRDGRFELRWTLEGAIEQPKSPSRVILLATEPGDCPFIADGDRADPGG